MGYVVEIVDVAQGQGPLEVSLVDVPEGPLEHNSFAFILSFLDSHNFIFSFPQTPLVSTRKFFFFITTLIHPLFVRFPLHLQYIL